MRFAYCRYEIELDVRNEQFIYRPLIPVRLSGPLGEDVFWGLLDTGADESYITQEMADFLGVIPFAGEIGTVESASGVMAVQSGTIGLQIEQQSESYDWSAIVGIVKEPWPEAILGHSGMLEFFDVTFLGAEKEVILKPKTQQSLAKPAKLALAALYTPSPPGLCCWLSWP